MKIAILGAGNMGGAIAAGLADSSHDIIVSNPSPEKLETLRAAHPGLQTTTDNALAVSGADVIILAVKPWLVRPVLEELSLDADQILVSLAAGISLAALKKLTASYQPVLRAMPNTAVRERSSMTVISADELCIGKETDTVMEIFSHLGRVMFLDEEKMDAAMSLASCGIAYVLKYVGTGIQAGLELGLHAEEARELLAQSLHGAADLLLDGDATPEEEVTRVCTPGGLTIKGINTLEEEGFDRALIRAFKASANIKTK